MAQKTPYEVLNASVPAPNWVDHLVLGADAPETYTVPTTTRFAIFSGDNPFWAKAGVQALASTGNGSAFGNQPSDDGVELVSSDNADTTQVMTIIGTTTGTDTVVVENVTLTGTSVASTVKTNWGVILAVKKSAATAGTVTVREASGNATIVTLAAAVLSAGVVSYSNTLPKGGLVLFVASGATTKQIGIKGTNSAGTVIYDSQALSGTTAVYSNSTFADVTEVYVGDVENSVSVTPTLGAASVPAADETDGYGSLYVPSTAQFRVGAGSTISFCRKPGTATIVSIGNYS